MMADKVFMIVMIMMMANMVMVRRIAMMMGTMCCACNFKVKPQPIFLRLPTFWSLSHHHFNHCGITIVTSPSIMMVIENFMSRHYTKNDDNDHHQDPENMITITISRLSGQTGCERAAAADSDESCSCCAACLSSSSSSSPSSSLPSMSFRFFLLSPLPPSSPSSGSYHVLVEHQIEPCAESISENFLHQRQQVATSNQCRTISNRLNF